MRFDFITAGRIIFGPGSVGEAPDLAAGLGRRILLVTGSDSERARPLRALLEERGLRAATFAVPGEPDIDLVRRGAAAVRDEGCEVVVGIGGGAALDTAKAIAILATNPGDPMDYLELIGPDLSLAVPSLPFIAIPTTAGTGSEATRNAVIASREHRIKVSMRSPLMLPRVAIVDPELTYGLPPAVTAATGLDALTQVLEPFVCTRANPITDGLCREGMVRIARSLRRAFRSVPVTGAAAPSPDVAAAREDLAVGSLFGGLALANAALGAVHGIAGPLGGMVAAPHGAICAALLPVVVAHNIRALRERAPQSPVLRRYAEVARLLTGDEAAAADDAVVWLRQLTADLAIPGLAAYGVGPLIGEELVGKALRANSMKANPVRFSGEELAALIEEAL